MHVLNWYLQFDVLEEIRAVLKFVEFVGFGSEKNSEYCIERSIYSSDRY